MASWEGPGQPIVLTVHGPDGQVVVPAGAQASLDAGPGVADARRAGHQGGLAGLGPALCCNGWRHLGMPDPGTKANVAHATRLCEQKPGETEASSRFGLYVRRWFRWARGDATPEIYETAGGGLA